MKRYVVGFIGVVLCCLGVFFVVSNYVDGNWPRVGGTVIGAREIGGVRSPVVEYEALGTTFQVISGDQPLFGNYDTGQKLRVAYNPGSPGEAAIVASGFLAGISWCLLASGALMIMAAVALHKRSQQDQADDELSDSDDSPDPSNRHI